MSAPSVLVAGTSPPPPALGGAYAECARIARASESSFVQAFRLLGPARRGGLEALYAFCRVIDDAVDDAADGRAALDEWRAELARALAGTATHPVTLALSDAVRRFGIVPQHLDEIVTGVAMDLERCRYETFDELRHYCYHVASAVGLATLPILGCRGAASRTYAESLGIAMQLTNILRDLAEDGERGRIYLPREDLRRFGYDERELLTHTRGPAFRALVRFECMRAETFYAAARAAMTPEDRRALAAAEGMRRVYQRLLARIATRPERVLEGRVAVPRYEKILCTLSAWLATRRGGGA